MEQTRTTVGVQGGSAAKGFFILIGSFFTMPIKTLKITAIELRQVGSKGKLDVETTNIPHLTWLQVAGHLVTSITVVIIVAVGILWGVTSLKNIRHSPGDALGGLILYPLGGVLTAVFANWFMAITIELLSLWTGIANDIRKMSQR